MSTDSNDSIDQGRLDLVPMIDCVMLLLLFFILTTHFRSEDQRLSALLSTAGGPGEGKVVMPPPQVNIAVLPEADGDALVRVGGNEPVRLHTAEFGGRGGPQLELAIDGFHRALAERLAPYEQPGTRAAQLPVEIHCATRLPWRCAMAVYDAVRGYEQRRLPGAEVPFAEQRAVAFAAPAVRGTATDNRYDELEYLGRLR